MKSIRQGRKVDIPPGLMPPCKDETDTDAKIESDFAVNRALDLQYDEGIKERNRKIKTLDGNVEAAYTWFGANTLHQYRLRSGQWLTILPSEMVSWCLIFSKRSRGTVLNSLIVITPINKYGTVTTLCLILNKEKETFWTSSRSNSMLSLKQQKITAAALG